MADISIQTPFGGGSGYDPVSSMAEIAINNLIGNAFSGFVGSYFGKKSAQYSQDLQKKLLKWQALKMPSLQKRGLIDAGYNPLLAVMNGANTGQLPSAYNAFQAMANLGSTSHGGASVTPYEGEKQSQEAKTSKAITKGAELDNDIKAQQLRQEKAAASVAEDESSARQVQAQVAEVEALATLDALGAYVNRDVRPSLDASGWNHRTARGVYTDGSYDSLVEKIRNSIDWDRKSKSDMNFWWRRGVEALHGVNEASSAYDSWKSARKPIHIYRR